MRESSTAAALVALAVNFHLYKPCDVRCLFCFATFRGVRGHLSWDDARRLIERLRDAGVQKITFAGGEPTLHPFIGDLTAFAKGAGFVTGIVTNGSRLRELLAAHSCHLDWAALSVDSASEDTQRALGRGKGSHVERAVGLSDACREAKVRVKVNTVVTALNWQEDMSDLVRRMRPERWKVFQVLRVEGQNDGSVETLLITAEQLQHFVRRHAHLAREGYAPIVEDNDAMTDSYAMIDPLGRFYGDSGGRHIVSEPILEVGVSRALSQVGFDARRLEARGGVYDWANTAGDRGGAR